MIELEVLGNDPIELEVTMPTGGGGGTVINNQNKTVNPSLATQQVTADAGYTGLGTVTVNPMPMGTVDDVQARITKNTSTHTATITPLAIVETDGFVEADEYTGNPYTVTASELVSGTKAITSNGTEDVTNYKDVNVNVPNSYTESDEGKVVNNGALTSQTSATYTENDTYDTTLIDEVTVDVATINNQDKTVTPTTSQQNVTADSGYTGLGTVTVEAMPSGTEGTPTASKGAVSNHSVDVTPSVTNTEGYIAGGTKTGTAVTVTASELVSGSETKTANGTYDVTNLASVVVDVDNSYTASDEGKVVSNGALVAQGSQTITENGTYDTTLVDDVTVNVSGGSGGNGYGGDGTWSRPLDMPKLDDMDISGGNIVYMTYIATEALGFCHLDIQRVSGSFTFEIGTISNGTFVAESTDTYSANTTIKKYFGSLVGGYKVIRVTGLISQITANRNSWTTYDGVYRYSRFQGIVEIYGELPNLGKIVFYGAGRLKAVRLGNCSFTDLATAFYNNNFIENVDANNWDVSNCTSLQYTFAGCPCLEKVDVSAWDTGKVANCQSTFQRVASTDIDISNWDMSAVTNTTTMFSETKMLELTIPASLTVISANTFGGDNQKLIYHFEATTPPTLANTNAFNSARTQMKIYVPSSAVEDYKNATNWSTYASYIEGE